MNQSGLEAKNTTLYQFTFDPFAYKIVYSLQVKHVHAQGKSMILYRREVLAGTC